MEKQMMNLVDFISTRGEGMQIHKNGKVFTPNKLVSALLSMGVILSINTAWADSLLNNITAIEQSANEVEVQLDFDGTPPSVQAYQIENPTRLVVDFPKTKAKVANRFFSFNPNSIASTYSVVDSSERTRIVFSMEDQGTYATRNEGNSLHLIMRRSNPVSTQPVAVIKPFFQPSRPAQASPINSGYVNPVMSQSPAVTVAQPVYAPQMVQAANTDAIGQIDFRRGNKGAGNVEIALVNKLPIDVSLEGSKVVIKVIGGTVPDSLRKRLDVNDFATPIKTIDAYNEKGNGIIVLQTSGKFEHQYYQTDNKLVVSVKVPEDKAKTVDLTKQKVYTGKQLSLNIQDMDVRQVLSIIAEFKGVNIVASDSIKDKITVQLQNVPWDQALDIILKSKGLAKRENGNVMLIAPAEELAKIEKSEMDSMVQQEQLAALQTEYIQLSYAKAADVINLLGSGANGSGAGAGAGSGAGASAGSNNSGDKSNGLLSNRGVVSVDARTNTIIVQDTADRIDDIRALISRIDIPVQQVMIEARIVRANDSFSKELGVRWGLLSNGITDNNSLLVGGSETTLWNLRKPTIDSTTGAATYTIDRPQNLNVDMGVNGAASKIALGLLSLPQGMIDLELSALQTDGKGEVVSTPKVLTMDKQKAKIASGSQIPYSTVSTTGVSQVSFKDVTLSLEVTPNITPDGRIAMELQVNNDSPGSIVPGGIAINTNSIQTNVLVDDGQTVVLGGVYETIVQNDTLKTPFLGDLPFVGRLFRKDVRVNDKKELLIFVTPRLVKTGSALR